jgi:hypothetical protein
MGTVREKNRDEKFDRLVKSLKMPVFVIPAKAGIQYFQPVRNLDSGFHQSDDFLRNHQIWYQVNVLKKDTAALVRPGG